MRIKFRKTPDQVELIKATVQKNEIEARKAQWAFADLMQPVLQGVLQQADTTGGFFTPFEFNEDDDPSFPLDPFRNLGDDYISLWSQEVAGGLPRNHVHLPTDEVKFATWRVDSAMSWDRKFNRKARLEIIAGFLTRLFQEILLKTDKNAWTTLMTALANASHPINGTATNHVFRATTKGTFDLDELNHWFTLVRRLNQSWSGGTPVGNQGFGLTDIFTSPEFVQEIRSLSYNPVNTKGANNVTGTAASGVVTLSESERQRLFSKAGVPDFMGVNLNILNEFGQGTYAYNLLFNAAAASTSYLNRAGAGGAVFDHTTEEIIFGVNNAAEPWAWRPIEQDGETSQDLRLLPDDQYTTRGEVVGSYGYRQVGHLITDTRPITGFIW